MKATGRSIVLTMTALSAATIAVAAAEQPCVRLKVRPTVMLVKQDIDVQARLAQHDDHRLIEFAWTADRRGNEGYFSDDLNGAREAPLQTLYKRDQPAANYEFTVIVRDGSGRVLGRDRAVISGPSTNP